MTPAQRLQVGIERLVNNLAIEQGLSRDRAIFLLESQLQDLKRRPPTPPESPIAEAPKISSRRRERTSLDQDRAPAEEER